MVIPLVYSNIYRFKTIADGLNSDEVRRKPAFSAGNAVSHPFEPARRSDQSVNQKTLAKQTPAALARTFRRAFGFDQAIAASPRRVPDPAISG